MAVPFLWTGFRASLEPHAALGSLITSEQPLTVRTFPGMWAILATAGWYGLVAWQRKAAWWQVALVLAASVLTLMRLGNAWLLAAALLPAIAARLAPIRAPGWLAAGLAAVLIGVSLYGGLSARPSSPPSGAVRAVDSAVAHGDTVLTAMSWASTLQQVVGTRATVLGAGDAWSVPPDYWPDYLQVSLGHVDWQAVLDRRDVTLLVLDAANAQSFGARLVRVSTAWQVVFDEDGALVARRRMG
jgi:hypothetical protein